MQAATAPSVPADPGPHSEQPFDPERLFRSDDPTVRRLTSQHHISEAVLRRLPAFRSNLPGDQARSLLSWKGPTPSSEDLDRLRALGLLWTDRGPRPDPEAVRKVCDTVLSLREEDDPVALSAWEDALRRATQIERRAVDGPRLAKSFRAFEDRASSPDALVAARDGYMGALERFEESGLEGEAAVLRGRAVIALRGTHFPAQSSAEHWLNAGRRETDAVQQRAWLTGEEFFSETAADEPEWAIPYLAVRGGLTVFYGPDSAGKSTLVGDGLAAWIYGEPFLGKTPAQWGATRVLYYAPDEPPQITRGRLRDVGLGPDDLTYVRSTTADPFAEIRARLEADPRLGIVVIDSATAAALKALGEVPSSGAADKWAMFMRPAADLAHEFDVSVLILHHARKGDGEIRDSGEIGAAADHVLGLHWWRGVRDVNETRRHLVYYGRYAQGSLDVVQTALGYEHYERPEDGAEKLNEPTAEERCLEFLKANAGPGLSQKDYRGGVPYVWEKEAVKIGRSLADRGLVSGVTVPGGGPWKIRITDAGREHLEKLRSVRVAAGEEMAIAEAQAAFTAEAESSPEREEADDA